MKFTYLLLLLLVLAGCGQKLEQSQSLTLPPEESEEEEAPPDRTFVVSNGQISALVFTPDGLYNGTRPPVSTASLVGGSLTIDSEDNNNLDLTLSEGARSLRLGVVTGAEPLATGLLYDLGLGAFLNLQDLSVGSRTWGATAVSTGGLTIVTLDDTTIEVDFNFTAVQPDTGQGTFDVSGHLTAELTPL
ncbi:MAG: hypothetical protein KF760_25165 [Candidatus Eremiobacteraeota bacterium]|nr:hypothetical protein [Candidatus Eremiobacteraeota bacterium]MCW5871025.1 hypothetical protein [Candidatus Eremiobacteraeota bacterium]